MEQCRNTWDLVLFTLGFFIYKSEPNLMHDTFYVTSRIIHTVFLEKRKAMHSIWQNHIHENNPAFVPDKKRIVMVNYILGLHDIKDIQEFCTRMKFQFPWAPLHPNLYDWKFPIAFLWVILWSMINFAPNYACQVCDIHEDFFAHPKGRLWFARDLVTWRINRQWR